ncbi:MAG: hypothetical protein V1710_06910, partial [Candidatus Bathyarchaeota archaeon]
MHAREDSLRDGHTRRHQPHATVTQPLPNIGLYASVTRKTLKGNTLGTEEAVDTETALGFYT